MFNQENLEPKVSNLSGAQPAQVFEIPEMLEFLSESEKQAIEREREYRTKGPGKIEDIINTEMDGLMKYMTEKMSAQDEDFIAKNVPAGKK